MGTAIAIVVLLSLALLLVRVPILLVLHWDRSDPRRWGLVVRLAGATLVRLPGPRESRPRSDDQAPLIPPWLWRVLDWGIAKWKKRRRGPSREGRSSGPLGVLGLLLDVLLVRTTRRLRLEIGGIDPAGLAALHGLFLSLRPLVPGADTFRFHPDWTVFEPRFRLVWSLRVSVAGFLGGLASVAFKGLRGAREADLPSSSEAPQPT